MPINPDDWSTLNRLLDEALDLPAGARGAWLAGLAPELDPLRPRLRALLEPSTGGGLLGTLPRVDAASPASEAVVPPALVGPYRVIGRIGEGGMGTVWLAERADGLVKRPVALKLPRVSVPMGGLADRMAHEREILAGLDHPNIARLYDAGLAADGQPYLALEFVAGCPVDRFVAERCPSVHERLQLFLQVARAVAHAHSRLVVHRDLKPSNILVTDDGRVKLLDFGIARLLDDGVAAAGDITRSCGRLLTPDYASPEQIAGEPLGTASDVFSLGILLYELLTDVRPWSAQRPRTPRQRTAPPPPSAVVSDRVRRRALRGDLDTIVGKALEAEPPDRYATVNAFAEDVERHLQGRPVLARPDGALYRCRKFLARNRAVATAAAAATIVMLGGAGAAAWQAHVASTEKARAREVGDLLTTVFRDTSPYTGRGRALTSIEWLKQARERVDRELADRPDLRAALLDTMGSSLLMLQDTAAADAVLSEAVATASINLGDADPRTLRARVLLTVVRRFQGRTAEARAALDRLLPVLRAREAPLAEELVIAWRNASQLDIDEGVYDRAERSAQAAVDVGVRHLGERHPETVAAFLMRALAYQFSREAGDALAAGEQAYQLTTEEYAGAPAHPRVIEARLVYGRALGEAGRRAEGLQQLERAVADAADVFGPTSRMVGFFSVPLARLQLEVGRVDEALANSRQAVTIIEAHSQRGAFRYLAALNTRGLALLAAGHTDDAVRDLGVVATAVTRALPPTHGVARWFRADYALALARAGRVAEADALARQLAAESTSPRDPVLARLRPIVALRAAAPSAPRRPSSPAAAAATGVER